MNFLLKIKKNILYFFLALPLLLIGYESFMSLALGSRTWSFLLIGQIAIVPLLAYIFHYIYNTLGQQTLLASILYFVLALIPIVVYIYILTNPTSLGSAAISIPSFNIPTLSAPTKEQIDSGFAIFGKVAIPLIVVLSIGLLTFSQEILGFFKGATRVNGNTIVNAIKFPFDSFFSMFKNNDPIIGDDICGVLPGNVDSVSKVPSFYLAHIAFFVGYILTNALTLYSKVKEPGTDEKGYNAIRYRTLMTMISLLVLYIILVIARYKTTGCESALGIFFSSSVFSSIGLGWYLLAQYCGCRSADLIGISNSIIPQSAKSPVVCLNPTASSP